MAREGDIALRNHYFGNLKIVERDGWLKRDGWLIRGMGG
jgi:hypothetical protein